MKKIIFLSLLLYGLNLEAQQVWTQQKGEGYFQIGSSLLSYSAIHIGDFKSANIPRPITEIILSSYGEYGLSDDFMLTLMVPYHFVSSGDLAADWNGLAPKKGDLAALGNINLGATYKIYQKNGVVVSSKLAIGLKSAKQEPLTGLNTGFDAFNITPLILAGIGTSRIFASAETGIHLLGNGYLPRFIFNAQIGKRLLMNKQLLGILGFSSSTTLGSPSEDDIKQLDENAILTGLYVNKQSYYALNLKLGYDLTEKGTIWLSAAGGAAENIGRNVAYSISFGYRFR